MDLLSRLEHALEDVVEGVFSRAFRTQLQPIEVAKRLTREVETHRTVSVSATYVPNVYTVQLSPETYAPFQALSGRLVAELEQYLHEFTLERKYQAVGPIVVSFAENPDVKTGEMLVTVQNDAGAKSNSAPPPVLRSFPSASVATAMDQEHTILISTAPPTTLEISEGELAGRRFPLSDGFSIGRDLANSLPLADKGISRHHVEIVRAAENWLLRDTGSTNGTYVNDRRVTEHILRSGDVVKIGNTVMKVN